MKRDLLTAKPRRARRQMNLSERWFRLLQRLYPADFRDEMGNALVEAYLEPCA